MTYKRETTTILAIAIMAAAMISASVVIALTMMSGGIGIPHAYACKKGDKTAPPGSCSGKAAAKKPRERRAA